MSDKRKKVDLGVTDKELIREFDKVLKKKYPWLTRTAGISMLIVDYCEKLEAKNKQG